MYMSVVLCVHNLNKIAQNPLFVLKSKLMPGVITQAM